MTWKEVETGKMQLKVMNELHDANIVLDHDYYAWLVYVGHKLGLYDEGTKGILYKRVGQLYPKE